MPSFNRCSPLCLVQVALTNLAESEESHAIFINIDGVATIIGHLDSMVSNKGFVQVGRVASTAEAPPLCC